MFSKNTINSSTGEERNSLLTLWAPAVKSKRTLRNGSATGGFIEGGVRESGSYER